LLAPATGPGQVDAPVNPTDHHLLLAPILVDGKAAALVEVARAAACDAGVQGVFARFLAGLGQCASLFLRNQQRRTMAARQSIWERLEAFHHQVHASLDLRAVALVVTNQGRQLIEGDRLSVLRRRRGRAVVEALSGAETIHPRARQVQLLADLGSAVLAWGEPLVYRGEPDEALPPDVLRALDAYLAYRECKLLSVLPLREADEPADFALVLECFEPPAEAEPLLDRLEVVGRRSRTALLNAALYHRVPLRWLWRALPELGSAKNAWGLWAVVTVVALLVALAGVSCPFKIEATGQLLPRERRWVYAPAEGQVVRFEEGVRPGVVVTEGQALALLHDTELESRLTQLEGEIAAAQADIAALVSQQSTAPSEPDRAAAASQRKQKETLRDRKLVELRALRQRLHAVEERPGDFWLTAPMTGSVLTWDFRERWANRVARPTEPLLRLGDRDRGWEVELKVPAAQLAPILEAFAAGGPGTELDVDLLLLSSPSRTFRGKLARKQLAVEATLDPDNSESAPAVRASVRTDGSDIAADERIPPDLLVSGTEVRGKVRCGPRRLGYVLLHGAWDFLYEHVFFQ
jgi:hypothetical protein